MPNFENYTFQLSPNGRTWTTFKAKSFHDAWESLASEDSGRTLDGYMHIYWVLRKIRKFEIVMPPCTYETIQEIINIVQGKEYYIMVFDPGKGTWVSYHVYTSNAAANMYNGIVMNGLYQDFEFHAIELGGEN